MLALPSSPSSSRVIGNGASAESCNRDRQFFGRFVPSVVHWQCRLIGLCGAALTFLDVQPLTRLRQASWDAASRDAAWLLLTRSSGTASLLRAASQLAQLLRLPVHRGAAPPLPATALPRPALHSLLCPALLLLPIVFGRAVRQLPISQSGLCGRTHLCPTNDTLSAMVRQQDDTAFAELHCSAQPWHIRYHANHDVTYA